MANTESPRSSRGEGATWIPIVVAVAAVAGFMVWLAAQERTPTTVVQEETEDTTGPIITGTVVAATDFGPNARTYVGQDVEIPSVVVSSPMTPRLFWIDLNGSPYLVKLDDSLTPESVGIVQNQRYTIVGAVQTRTDSVLNAWEAAGVIADDGHKLQVEFADTYIEARRVTPMPGGGAEPPPSEE